LYIAAPNTDQLFTPEQRARTVEILAENEQKFNMQIFSGVSHGFAVSLALYTHAMLNNVY
jgi:dienelactone hydrolase